VLEALLRGGSAFWFLELLIRYGEPDAAAQVWNRWSCFLDLRIGGRPIGYVDWLIQMKQTAAVAKHGTRSKSIEPAATHLGRFSC